MDRPVITTDNTVTLLETKFLNVFDLQYQEGKHYYAATRHKKEDLAAVYPDEKFSSFIPDAVTLCVILDTQPEERLLLFYEYRYPTGRFLLSPPAGLIDQSDKEEEDPVFIAAVRELFEETGIVFKENDSYRLLNPGLFSSPGMTDETSAVVLFVIHDPDMSAINDRNTEGTELFDGYRFLNREEALKCIAEGKDEHGFRYSVQTWQALLYFVSGLWRK